MFEAVGVLCQLPNTLVSTVAVAILACCLYQGRRKTNSTFEQEEVVKWCTSRREDNPSLWNRRQTRPYCFLMPMYQWSHLHKLQPHTKSWLFILFYPLCQPMSFLVGETENSMSWQIIVLAAWAATIVEWITVNNSKKKKKTRNLDDMKPTSANNCQLTLADLAIVLTRLTNCHRWNHQKSYSLWLIRLSNDTIYWLTYQVSDSLRVDWPLRPHCSDGCYSAQYAAGESRNVFTSRDASRV